MDSNTKLKENSLTMAADKECAERIRFSILQNFTYDDIENETEISVSSLKRLASGEKEPKLIEIRKIAKATGKNPVWLAFGESTDENIDISEKLKELSNEAEHSVKTRIFAAIKDMDLDDAIFIEKLTELLNLQKTIYSLSDRKLKAPYK